MKLVYCIAGTRHSGGMERVLANKANWLVEHGHEVCIVTTDQEGEKPFFALDDRIRCYDLGVNYEENNGGAFVDKLIHYPVKQYRHKKRLAKLLKDLRADVVISMFCNDAGFLPDIKDGSRKILEIHFSRFKRVQYGRKGLWRLADLWRSRNDVKVASRFDRFVVLTNEDRGYWGDMENICVIPNARTFTCDKPAALDAKRVIAVGRYNYQKGFDRLIEAWSLVAKRVPGWTLEIIGTGELRDDMLRQIEALGLEDSVILRSVGADEMRDVYLGSSLIVMSSHYEGLPMVLLEAQAAGLPIVSFACKCGPKDLVRDGENGFLVPEGDVEALADRMVRVMEDDALRKRMGAEAYKDSEKFSEEAIMGQWEEMLLEIKTKTL